MKISLIKDLDELNSKIIIINLFKEDVINGKFNSSELNKIDFFRQNIQKALDNKHLSVERGKIFYCYEVRKNLSLLFIGSGSKKKLNIEQFKLQIAKSIRFVKNHFYESVSLYFRGLEDNKNRLALCVEALYVGNYRFIEFKENKNNNNKSIKSVQIFSDEDSLEMITEGQIIGESINFTRNLINRPGNYCTPTMLANYAKEFAKETELKLVIYEKTDLEKMKMNSFLSVAKGSNEPPKLIIMHHNPINKKSKEKLALLGKGVTFDTGGISLKPSAKLSEMKTDMSGAAVVISAMIAISKLNLPVEVLAIIPSTENMPSGKAIKPGDIVTAMNGKNIEILDTDAEGRLILADALSYAVKENATRIIDVATLTGACVVALGEIVTGLMGNKQSFIDDFKNISDSCGEKVWQLPLFQEYHEQIKSDIADVANIGGRWAGAITAACFLENFVNNIPWIHLDIAGTNWSSKDSYYSKGATGIMVSSFVHYVKYLTSSII